jgi:hypothetical protein
MFESYTVFLARLWSQRYPPMLLLGTLDHAG